MNHAEPTYIGPTVPDHLTVNAPSIDAFKARLDHGQPDGLLRGLSASEAAQGKSQGKSDEYRRLKLSVESHTRLQRPHRGCSRGRRNRSENSQTVSFPIQHIEVRPTKYCRFHFQSRC